MMTIPQAPKRKNGETTNRRLLLSLSLLMAVGVIALLFWSREQPQNDLPTARLLYHEGARLISLNLQTGERLELPFDQYQQRKLSPDGRLSAHWDDINICCDSSLVIWQSGPPLNTPIPTIEGEPERALGFGMHYGSSGTVNWSPDSQWVIFSAEPQAEDYYNNTPHDQGLPILKEELYMANVYTREKKRLTENNFIDHYPSISPDGARIAYTSDADGEHRLYIMDIATGGSHLLTPDQDGRKPMWSPDGRWLAFITNCDAEPSQYHHCGDLWIIRADGTGAQSIQADTGAVEAMWLP